MVRVLVTGGAGFIGSNFVRMLLSNYSDVEVVVLDALTYAGVFENIEELLSEPRFTFVKGDIRDRRAVRKALQGCDAVVHMAAETHVDRSILDPDAFVLTDVYGTFVLLDEATKGWGVKSGKCKGKRFVHLSTDEVYGEALRPEGSVETDPLFPRSPYAASKAGADRLAWAFFETYGLPVVIVRGANAYGPRQYPEKAIPYFVTSALMGKSIPVYGTGENEREWTFVEDFCSAVEILLLAEESKVVGEVFNMGSGERVKVIDVARAIVKELGLSEGVIELVGDRPAHVRRHALDSGRIRRELGWEPKVNFEEGVRRTVKWYRDNQWWWRPIRESKEFREYEGRWYGALRARR